MSQVTITRVTATDKAKDGHALISKYNKPYFKVGIQCNEFGDTWINGLMPFNPTNWQGTTQDLEVYDEDYQGKTYKKFKLPAKEDKAGGLTEGDRAMIKKAAEYAYAANTNIVLLVTALKESGVLKEKKNDYPASPSKMPFEDDINPADIPFGDINPEDISFGN